MLLNFNIVKKVDIISANAFPFWEKTDIAIAAQSLQSRLGPLLISAKAKNKNIIIGETGWSSKGQTDKASTASPENAAVRSFGVYLITMLLQPLINYLLGLDLLE